MRSSVLITLITTCTLTTLILPTRVAFAAPEAAPPAATAPGPSTSPSAPAPAAATPTPAPAPTAAAPVAVPEGTTVTTVPGGATIVINNAPTVAPTVSHQAAPTTAAAAPKPEPAPVAAPAPPPCPTVVPPPPPARPTPPLPENNGVASLVTGASMLGSVYVVTALVAARRLDDTRYESSYEDEGARERKEAASRALLIPVVGPFIAMPNSGSNAQTYRLALNGSMQVAGAVLMVVGAALNARYQRAKRWQVMASTRRDGATAGVRVRF